MIGGVMVRILLMILLLSGCSSNPNVTAKGLLETLEFGEDETGCFRVTGTIALSATIFASSNVAVSLVKKKGTDLDPAPDC